MGSPSFVQRHAEQLFHTLGPVYDRLTDHELWRAQNARLMERATERLGRPPHAVLDVGCGTGVGTLAMAAALPPTARVTGLDLTPAMIERARHYHRARGADPRVRFVVGDATCTGFATGSFDTVVGNSVLYLVPDAPSVLRELARVLAPGGVLIFMEPHAEGSLRRAARQALRHGEAARSAPVSALLLATSMASWRAFSGAAGRKPAARQRALLEEAGFVDVTSTGTLGGLGVHVAGRRP